MKNRKRLLTLALLCMALAFSVLGLFACGNADNRDPQIVAVYNAYVANANEKGSTPLSYEEWLKSIKGEKGDKGDPGKSAYEIWLDNGFTGTEQDFLNWLKNQSNNADSLGLSFALTDEDTYSVSVGLATERSEIVIPATYNNKPVTKIANKAFMGCTNLKKVTIPDSITSIGNNAFSDCESLTSITIGNGVTAIGEYAFSNCDSLSAVYITEDIAAWCNIKFSTSVSNPLCYAHNLYLNGELVTDLVTPDSVTIIREYAFYNCTSLTSITIPDSVTSIGNYAFSSCTSLTSITIPDSVTSIGNYAFSSCTSLTSITIPDSITTISNYAFSGCTSLTSVTIPDSVTSIGDYAFYRCTALNAVCISNLIAWCKLDFNAVQDRPDGFVKYITNPLYYAKNLYLNGKLVTDLIIPKEIKTIKKYAFYNCTSLTSVAIHEGIATIDEFAFYKCSSLNAVYISDIAAFCSIDFKASYCFEYRYPSSTTQFDSVYYISNPLYTAHNLYLNGEHITNLVFPNNITDISNYAFSGCTSLTSVTISDSVTSVGIEAFKDCKSLNAVYITNIAAWCNIKFNDNPLPYARNLYLNGELVIDLVIPDSVTSISDDAFRGCDSLASVTMGNGVTSIGAYAFFNCTSLTNVTIPDSVTTIGDRAFHECYKLVEVINKSNLNITKGSSYNGAVGYYALKVKSNGQSDIVNKNDYLFYTYNNINYLLGYVGNDTNLNLPDNYNGENYQIYKYAFSYCRALTSVTKGKGVTSIGDSAFISCTSLTSVTFSDNVTWIGYNAFYNCTSLTSVTIPDSVINISDNAFYGCNNIQTAFYKGGKMQWDNMLKGNGLANLINKLYFYSEAAPTDSGKYWHYAADGVTPVIW